MALSREFLKRLTSEDEPLPKRIKLAESAFYANDLPLVQREDLILNWLCKICPNDLEAWNTLKFCLKQHQLDIKDEVKQSLIDIVVQSLMENPGSESNTGKLVYCQPVNLCENLMLYCKLLVSNSTMQQYFAREPKAFVCLVESVLKNSYECLKETFSNMGHTDFSKGIDIDIINEQGGGILSIYNILIYIVESVLQIYKISYATKEELRYAFIESVLYPLCRIIDHKCLDSTNRLGATAHKCIQQLVFGRKNAQSKSQKGNNDVFERVLAKLNENIENADLESNMLVFTSLFRAAIGVFKDDSAKLDVIFRSLVESAGMHNKKVMSACLKCMQDVTIDFDHKVNDVTLFAYCQGNMDALFLQETFTRIDLKLIAQLAHFNPLIIERKIPDILRKVLLKKRTSKWSELMLAILDISVRLRKEDKLVSQILIALRSSLAEEVPQSQWQQFFPSEFINKFTKTINNITSSQTVVILRALIYNLNISCTDMVNHEDLSSDVPLMQATVELLTAFFNGLCIFEYKGTLEWHQKLINALEELGNLLAASVDNALQLNYNETIIELLLTAMESWTKIRAALEYYIPKIAMQKSNSFPVSEDQWQQLVQRVANFGRDQSKSIMNRLIIRKSQVLENGSSKNSVKLSGLIGGIKHFWPSLLQHNIEAVPSLKLSQLTELASLLLDEMLLDKEKFDYWLNVLKNDHIQECRSFVVLLLSHGLIKIGDMLPESPLKNMFGFVKVSHMMAAEFDGCDKIQEDTKGVKKLLHEGCKMCYKLLKKMKPIMIILSELPLGFLTGDVRVFTYLIIFAITEMCFYNGCEKTETICHTILSDLVDRPGINVCRYLSPDLYVFQMYRHKHIQMAIELSIRKGLSEKRLRDISEYCVFLEDKCLLLDYLENVRPKLSSARRQTIKKIEEELVDAILPNLTYHVTYPIDVQAILAVAKYSFSGGSNNMQKKKVVRNALQDIFARDIEWNPAIKEAGAQLAVIALRHSHLFIIKEFVVKGLWQYLLDNPNNNLLLALVDFTEKTDFEMVLQDLHTRMLESLAENNHVRQENISLIWKAILKTDMSSERNKVRLAAIDKLLAAVHNLNIPEKAWPTVLKLLCNVANAKHLYLSGSLVDVCLHLGVRSVDEAKLAACDEALTLCGIVIRNRPSLIIDRLPILLLLYKRIISSVTMASKTSVDMTAEYALRCLAINIEKVTGSLIKMKKDLLRLAPYLVADLLELFADASIALYVKESLQNCISQLISVCDQHGIALLSRTLPPAMQEIFKTQVDTFNKFYKFSGKI